MSQKTQRATQNGLQQYRAQIIADGKPMSSTIFSDWFENDSAAREGLVQLMAEQGYAVFSVVIGEITQVHVDKRIVLTAGIDENNTGKVWHWKIQGSDKGGYSATPQDAVNDARILLKEAQ